MSKLSYNLVFVLLLLCSGKVAATVYSLTHNNPLYQCQQQAPYIHSQDLAAASCDPIQLQQVNPQGDHFYLVIEAELSQYEQKVNAPYGLFVYAKAASRVYVNGELLGENGYPSPLKSNEKVGRMDANFYLPEGLIKMGVNYIAIEMSAHHGWFDLARPVHFIGFGPYQQANNLIQQNLHFGLILLGMLLLGLIYFTTLSFNPVKRKSSLFFLFMSLFACSQLTVEMARGLVSYDYPWHDIRLLLINLLSMAFGCCLLLFICFKFAGNSRWHWIYGGVMLTGLGVILVPGFDPKTTLATFIPSVVSLLLIGLQAYQQKDKSLWVYFAVFLLFLLTIVATVRYFHEFWFYLMISCLLCYLVVQQTREYAKEQGLRLEEQKQVAKLEYQLMQTNQKQQSDRLKISAAGKVELLATDDILYCQAAGDYVEIHLQDRMVLFSGSLKKITEQLPAIFIKIHRSYLVNLTKVEALISDNGGGQLQLNNQTQLPVSRRLMPEVRNLVNAV